MVKVLLSENRTGIVLRPDGSRFQRKEGEGLPYLYFDTREEAMEYVNKIKSEDDSIEFTLWDGDLPPERLEYPLIQQSERKKMDEFKYRVAWCKDCNQGWLVILKDSASGKLYICCTEDDALFESPEKILPEQCIGQWEVGKLGHGEPPPPEEICKLGWEKYLLDKDAKAECVRCLLPKEKCDTSHIAQLALLSDEEIAPILPELLEWFMDENWGVAKPLVPVLLRHEEILIPHIKEILSQDDLIWQEWIMELLIPHFTSKGKQTLRPYVQRIAQLKEKNEDTLCAVEDAKECLAAMEGN